MQIVERLNWDKHTNNICKKVSQAIAGLKKSRPYITQNIAVIIFNSLVQPLFDYCDVVWDNLSITQATRLQKLKNWAGRVITQKGYETRSHVIREELGWDTLQHTRNKHKVILMYKILNSLAPQYLADQFITLKVQIFII